MWITWKHQDDEFALPLSFEDKVEIFYQQALGWQLHVADLIANGGQPLGEDTHVQPLRHSGFAVLHICLSYFETIGHYERSDRETSIPFAYFKAGVHSVLPGLIETHGEDIDGLLTALYEGARCGLYHNSRTLPGIGLGQPPGHEAIAYDPSTRALAISPERLPRTLKRHLERFRKKLLNPANVAARDHFERRFDKDYGIAGAASPRSGCGGRHRATRRRRR